MNISIILHSITIAGICWLIYRQERDMAAIDNLETEVGEDTDVKASAVTLLDNLKTALDEAIASGDMSRVQQLSDKLSASTDSLAAAVARNTPTT